MMPAKPFRPKCRHIFTLIAALLVVPASVAAQSSVTLAGRVSETVTLSVAPGFTQSNVEVVTSVGNTVRLTISSGDAVIRVPLLVRSNSSFKISANFESTTAELNQLNVTDVHPTGSLTSPRVVNALEVNRQPHPDVSHPWLVVSGPRVSIGGTLVSPNNALQITLLIHLKPQQDRGPVNLTFVATAGSLAP
jgi:hypothetical protein